jgi:hypothetical protein
VRGRGGAARQFYIKMGVIMAANLKPAERRVCAAAVLQPPVATTGADRLVLQLPQLPAGCEARRRFCDRASCGSVVVAQGDFATEIASAVAAQ